MAGKDAIPVRTPGTASRVLDGQAVVLTLKDAQVNVMNSVGTRVWELIDGNRTLGDIASVMGTEFEVSAEQALEDASEFVEDLADKGMLTLERRD